MKEKTICLVIILLGLFILPNNVMADEIGTGVETGLNGEACAGAISLQRLNGRNDVGRYWNISIGYGKDRARVYCMDEGKKARTGEICVKQRVATNEEVRDIVGLVENKEVLAGVSAKVADNIQISAGQGNLNDASIRMAMLSGGYDQYSANRVSKNVLSTVANTTSNKVWYVYVCNGDGTGDNWQRMLVPDSYNSCYIPEKESEKCYGGSMVMEGNIGKCENSKKDGNGQLFEFEYSATEGDLYYVNRAYGEDLPQANVGKYCKVYCTERGWATLPGAIGEALQLGSYIVWPTSPENFTNDKYQIKFYPLNFKGELICELEIMTDLEEHHEDMPVGCKTDVVEIYKRHWKTILDYKDKYDWYKPDANMTYEQLRHDIIKRTTNPDGECKAYYNSGGFGCNNYGKVYTRYMVKGHYKTYEGCEEILGAGRGPEKNYLEELKDKYGALNCTENDTETVYDRCQNADGTWRNCNERQEPTACAKEKRSLRDQINAQQAVVNDLDSKYAAVEDSISACTNYINAYEVDARIHHQMFMCSSWNISADDYQFSSNARMEYSDATQEKSNKGLISYTTGDVNVYHSDESVETTETAKFTNDIPDDDNAAVTRFYPAEQFYSILDSMKNKKYIVTKADYYTLETPYHYLDKNKLTYTKDEPKSTDKKTANFLQIKTKKMVDGKVEINEQSGIIPTSYDNKTTEDYTLKIFDISFGQAGFGTGSDGTVISGDTEGSSYICKQRFIDNSDRCICPENTLNAGKSLSCSLDGMTCLDAQDEYCDDPTYEEKEGCDLYCDNDPTMPLTDCLNSGLTVAECNTSDYCGDYHCPNNVGAENQEKMDRDLHKCVVKQMAQGVSKDAAIEYCEPFACNVVGRTIIYRTIKLENPFPSYNSDDTVTQPKLTKGMFNDDIRGRFPGSNWDSVKVVSKKIRNNRGAHGTTIYQTKEPLYTFILNGATISNIRDYNDSIPAGYNDFSLTCKKNRSVACISEFVHGTSKAGNIGLVGGTCEKATSKTDFDSCVNNLNKTS